MPIFPEMSQVWAWGVAGVWPLRRRSGATTSQVCVFATTCDANRPQTQKNVAGPESLRRGSAFLPSPATQIGHRRKNNVAGPESQRRGSAFLPPPATLIGHRRKNPSQVRSHSVACLRFCRHLRRKSATGDKNRRGSGIFCRPATLGLSTGDTR